MPRQPLRILISGASVAGPTAAYWLCRQGFAVTVVERMPLTRVRSSGHAVDLFGPAMDVAEWTGVLPAVMEARRGRRTPLHRPSVGVRTRGSVPRFLGGYLAIFAMPNYLDLEGRMVVYNAPGRLAAIYPVQRSAHTGRRRRLLTRAGSWGRH
jgi:glycine/D-amino acid oxidase-like deaminating enzyme